MDCAKPAADRAGPSAAILDADSAMNLTRPDGLASGIAGESDASSTEVLCDGP
jgi:hypothetical protein